MNINNGFNVLPWYDSLEKQNSKKWYAYGQAWPLLCPQGFILPFQFICDSAITITSTIHAVNTQTGASVNLGVTPTVTEITRADATYYLVKLNSVAVTSLPIGRYNLRMNTSIGYLYSEEITIINNASECIKLEYWNEDTLRFTSGEINFDDNFHFILYINSTIGKPEYEFEEELTKRLGYKFIESQTSNKLYKFAFAAPEYICDALRLVRMCDYIKLTTKYDSYNALSFAYEPKWQEQGDLAAVDVEFDTDCIIQKLESFNRRVKESFYNALLADIDEPVLFSTDTVAQYYTEYTSVSSINGKLIRQLNAISPLELQDNLDSLVLALDNQADSKQEAKKVFLSDILGLIDSVSKLFKGHYDEAGNLLWIEALSHIGVNGGLTMFIADGEISLPSLYDGLPIDNSTLIWKDGVLMLNPNIDLGGASSWDELEGKPSWITDTKPIYNYSEIKNTPDLSVFVTSTALSETLADYATLTYLTGELKKYVTLDGAQDIKGVKNFVKGLKIGGMPITKMQDDVIYIDANLVVRGGVTMYGGEFDSTDIMDAIVTDETTILNDNGVLKLNPNIQLGGVDSSEVLSIVSGAGYITSSALSGYLPKSGGTINGLLVISNASWGNQLTINRYNSNGNSVIQYTNSDDGILGSIGVAGKGSGSNAFQPVFNDKNKTEYQIYHRGNLTKLSQLTDDVVNGKYLPLSGGTITTSNIALTINRTGVLNSAIRYMIDGVEQGSLGFYKTLGLAYYDASNVGWYKVWHENNDGSGSGLDADLLDGLQPSELNVGSATKLQTARAIWGQSFDGTGNIDGNFVLPNNVKIKGKSSSGEEADLLYRSTSNDLLLGLGIAHQGNSTYIYGKNVLLNYGNGASAGLMLSYKGNVLIGTTTDSGYKLDVNGTVQITNQGNGVELLRLNSERAWAFKQEGTTAETSLVLQSLYNGKAFVIKNEDGTAAVSFGTDNAQGNRYVSVNSKLYPNQSGLFDLGRTDKYWNNSYINNGYFLNKVQINGIPIYKSQDDVLYIDGNLVVRGGVTMYAENEVDIPSIIDSLPIASTTSLGVAKFDSNFFSVGSDGKVTFIGSNNGGVADSVAWSNVTGKPSWIGTSKPSYSWSEITSKPTFATVATSGKYSDLSGKPTIPTVPTSLKNPYALSWSGYSSGSYDGSSAKSITIPSNTNQLTNGAGFITSSALSSYLPLSGGSVNGTIKCDLIRTLNNVWVYGYDVSNKTVSFGSANVGQHTEINGDSVTISSWAASTNVVGYIKIINNGNVGVGTPSPSEKLDVVGYVKSSDGYHLANTTSSYCGLVAARRVTNGGDARDIWLYNNHRICIYGDTGVTVATDLLVSGGITMYSDIRKKTKLQDVELSLSQIANAPLIQHYYNSDQEKTTHVGSIAQYWARINDWFCKLDNEGYYTMEIQNCALASAISIARHLEKYESKTDKKIRMLKKRVQELEDKLEKLEGGNYGSS